jgi:branched-chain amino acid transport system ATP-binding protein
VTSKAFWRSELVNKTNILEVEGLNIGYRSLQVLWDINIEVKKNTIVSIIGANGSGKSTLVKAITGIIPIMSGRIKFREKEISNLLPHERVKERLVMIPDERGLFPEMTVLENLQMGGYPIKDKAKIEEAIIWGFDLFPILKKRAHQNAGSLSGGEQQMLAMAKALVAQPQLLILDEPSSGLAPIIIDKMFQVLIDIKKKNITVLLVEQNVRRSLKISDYCYVLENGRIGMEGLSASIKDKEEIKELYLGM